MDDHVETLRRYNRWRRGQDCEEMQDPRVVGDAIDAACDKIDRLRAELAECIAALEKIANPIGAMKRALPVGATLNGAMATTLSNDPNYLKGIAKAALAARKGEGNHDF